MNLSKEVEVVVPSKEEISCIEFSPEILKKRLLAAGCWDCKIICWEIAEDEPIKIKYSGEIILNGPVLDVAWNNTGSKIFIACGDATVKSCDLESNTIIQVGKHDKPVRTVNWVNKADDCLLMTGSWDHSLKIWDVRAANSVLTIPLSEKCYCADVMYPVAVIGTANRGVYAYHFNKGLEKLTSSLEFQHIAVAIFSDEQGYPDGYSLASEAGRVAVQPLLSGKREAFSFKCHRSKIGINNMHEKIFAVNDIAIHPVHRTLATVGSDGRFSFWDVDSQMKLMTSSRKNDSITSCCFDQNGNILAYATKFNRFKKRADNDIQQYKDTIILRSCFEEIRPYSKR